MFWVFKRQQQDKSKANDTTKADNKRLLTAVLLGCVFVSMLGLAYASVPLYELFCRVTGYGGTPQQVTEETVSAEYMDESLSGRKFIIDFDANTDQELSWIFEPVEPFVNFTLGEDPKTIYYRATNTSDETITGSATFNVTPLKIGGYFIKVQCFCFQEQTLQPKETVDMPVVFYIDPEIETEPSLKDVEEITLSYTFYRIEQNK